MGLATQMMQEVADLIRLGFPESTATKIASGELPMDTASRMQRAEEQGYSPDVVYRGVGKDYDPDKAGYYQMFTSSSQDAAEYGDNVIEARLNLGDSIEVDGRGRNFNNIYVGDLPSNLFDRLHSSERESLIARTDDLAHAANKAGNDSLIIKNIHDKADNEIPKRPSPETISNMPDIELLRELGIEVDATPAKSGDSFVDTKNYDPVDVSVVFDPSRVRSVDAAFDPDYKGSNILGEYALPAGSTALMASLLAAPEEAEAGFVTRGGRELLEAWHGSPHEFDRFSMDAIGTGEGAQAYGHGLYFADSKDVATGYRDNLKDWDSVFKMNNRLDELQSEIDSASGEKLKKLVSEYEQVAEAREIAMSDPGSLYRTEIDVTPESLLDWDRPLSEQPNAMRAFQEIYSDEAMRLDPEILGPLYSNPNDVEMSTLGLFGKSIGAQAYNTVKDMNYVRGAPEMSEKLKEKGIKGIKYLDGNSRSRPMREVRDQFLDELPEDAEIDDVIELLDGDTFSPENKTLLQSLAADDWLGFDYPSQSLSAALGDNLSNYDASPELTEVIRAIRDNPENTSNYVIFDDKLINIAERGAATPGMLALLGAGGAGATAAGSESNAVTEATSRIVNHMLDNVTEVTDLLEIPQRGIQGLLRAGYGLMQGDGLDASLNAGADVVNQGVEATAKQAGDAMLEKTGNPELATMAYTAVMLGSPL